MGANTSDQPSLSYVKPEPLFIGPKNIAVPDPVDFHSYCSVSDSVGTDADELVPWAITSASSEILPATTPKLLSESVAAPRLTVFETPIKPDLT